MFEFFTKGITKLFGSQSSRDLKELTPLVESINEIFKDLHNLSNNDLRDQTRIFKERIAEGLKEIDTEIENLRTRGEDPSISIEESDEVFNEIDKLKKERDEQLEVILEQLLPEAFAVVKETARRFKENESITSLATELDRDLSVTNDHISIEGDQVTYQTKWLAAGSLVEWDMLHYDVQLMGGIFLHQGKIAEMATGEGKTLVATLPAYLNALSGQGVSIVTVNNYLALRDSEWMAPIFNFLGITIDCIDRYKPHSEDRKKAYRADITYGTNNEFGFDYLRDNMVRKKEEQVQGKLHFGMIDEVDSVLIDDARTPLIISGPIPKGDEHEFHDLKPRIQKLVNAQKQVTMKFLQEAKRQISEGKSGPREGGLALLRAHRGLPKNKALIKYLSEEGIKQLLLKAENNYLQDQAKEMPFVDEELYFTIDEKQNQIDLTEKGLELITTEGEDKSFFILPDVGMRISEIDNSSDSDEEKVKKKDALLQDFSIKSERIHSMQQLLKAYTIFEKDVEYVVMDSKVKIVDEQTGRIMDGRRYSDGLHQAIEAKENVKVESATQTFATITLQNFFRMFHKLSGMTGTAETEAGEFFEIYKLPTVVVPTNKPIIRDDQEDVVYKTKREKYNALIEDIEKFSSAGRPVLVGTTNVEVSELLSKMLSLKKIKHNVLNAKQHQREADIVAEAGKAGTVTIATNMAGRGTDIKLGEGVKEAGGLAIIGSERHDSRRVDRQLRGRAGRQGDPGGSQFYVSLEDNLMRLFGSERIAKVMDKMGYKEGEMIQHSMITKSIERAQKKIEENNFGIRKRLLEYDDVMNTQREVIYKRRQHALDGERLSHDIQNGFYDLCEELINTHKPSSDFESFRLDCIRYFSIDTTIDESTFTGGSESTLIDQLYDEVSAAYARKGEALKKMAMPVLKRIHEKRGAEVTNVLIPLSDGKKTLNSSVNLEEVIASEGKTLNKAFEKTLTLAIIDNAWKEHLRQMDDLKQSVQLAVHEQKDPLLIYKFEAFNLFKSLLSEVAKEITSFLFKSSLPVADPDEINQAKEMPTKKTTFKEGRGAMEVSARSVPPTPTGGNETATRVEPVRVADKVGRNEPCPCGSGKKFKQCHGKLN